MTKSSIWTVGPPFLSLTEKIFPVKIFYKKQALAYQFHHYEHKCTNRSYDHFQIDTSSILEKNPILSFVGENWKVNTPVSLFPQPKTKIHSGLTLSVLQKNYAASHIVDWVLWHHHLYNIRRILFYDNNSENQKEVKKELQNLNIENLEIVFIPWNYYYGCSPRFDDLFAQSAQLTHTLKLHEKQKSHIGNWDMDEFLVCSNAKAWKKSLRNFYSELKNYNIVNTENYPIKKINECLVREKKNISSPKYIYKSNTIRYITCPHYIERTQIKMNLKQIIIHLIRTPRRIIDRIFKKLSIIQSRPSDLYLIHAQPIKVVWKDSKATFFKRYQVPFDPKIHIKDKNIEKSLKKAELL